MSQLARIQRLELLVYKLCKNAVDNDHSWGKWADWLSERLEEKGERG